ncbi:Bgt-20323 [Blumeria graminis f. sp. tritici]|uniref:Bgt-20323 n=1 Tax=Blumeria graminis f. sp. tritici TaxID=62690 RepID=A0A9X9ME91_BLUGR|nr:Bgt-20323 [Blumeria graminis f. sp. tritici]
MVLSKLYVKDINLLYLLRKRSRPMNFVY